MQTLYIVFFKCRQTFFKTLSEFWFNSDVNDVWCVSVQVREMCQQVKEQMFEYYEQHSQGMEASIAELSEVLERCSQLSMELQGASQTLAIINKGLQHSTEQ